MPPARASVGNIVTDGSGNSTVYLQAATITDTLKAIDIATGVRTATIASGAATVATATGQTASSVNVSGVVNLSTGTAADLAITGTGNALSVLGLTGATGTDTNFSASRTAGAGGINGKTLSFTSFNGGTAVDVTFGDGTGGTVKTLDQLNTKLQANNQTATIDSTGKLTISATNDYASSTLGSVASGGVIGGTVTSALAFSTASAPVVDGAAQSVRSQPGEAVQRHPGPDHQHGPGRFVQRRQPARRRPAQADLQRNRQVDVEHHRRQLQRGRSRSRQPRERHRLHRQRRHQQGHRQPERSVHQLLRTQGSALGSNLSIVQIRQDFSKNLINVLQTGSSNLTLADTNEEAANSQALSTRQSIAVSALALANQSQQSVLQLLR